MKKNVAFIINHFSERGTEVSTFNFAFNNKTILGNNSIIIAFNKDVSDRKQSFINTSRSIFEAEFKIGDEILKYRNKNLAIKIDVEGHEIYVLQGIEKLLKSNKCILQIELFDKNFPIVNSYLNNNGYKNIDNVKERSNYFYSNF